MSEWKEYKLRNVCEVLNGRAYKQEELLSKGKYPVLRVGNIFQGNNWYYSDLELPENKYCYKGDLLYAWSCGFAPYIWEGDKTIYHYHIWKLIENKEILDRKFLYYYLIINTKRFVGGIHGSVMVHLTKKDMENQILKVPSLPTQQKIANILSSLDDKIEVNRRINEQLEELAQALFKSWFVDFEPFKDGEFVESELGMIPEGWKVGTLGEVCNKITDGSHYSPKDNPNSNIPMLSVKDMQKYSFDYSKAKHIDEEEFAKMKSNDCVPLVNDILVAKDGSYLKEIFICRNEIKQAILSSIAIFRANKSIIYPIVLLCVLKSPRTLKNVSENYVSGSALPRIVLKDFKRYNIIIPPIDCQERFNDIISSIYDKIYANEEEITHLTNLRDTLLPKLMSGEIDVDEVEI